MEINNDINKNQNLILALQQIIEETVDMDNLNSKGIITFYEIFKIATHALQENNTDLILALQQIISEIPYFEQLQQIFDGKMDNNGFYKIYKIATHALLENKTHDDI